jgi:streptogramin lyase
MNRNNPVVHGRHRRRPNRLHAALIVVVLVVIAGVLVIVALAGGQVDMPSEGRAQGSAPRAAGDTSSQVHQHAPAPSTGTSPPAASGAIPGVGTAMAVGRAPHDVAVSPDGTFAYVADPVAGAIIRLSTMANEPMVVIPIPQGPPQMVTFAPDGSRAYLSVYDDDFTANHIVFLDTRTETVVKAVSVGRGPYAAATTRDGRRALVTNFGDGTVRMIDTAAAG